MNEQAAALDKLLNTTPEMQNAPGVAVPLSGMPGDSQQYGQALAQTNKYQALSNVVEEHTAKVGGSSNFAKVLGFFGHAAGEITHPIGEAVGGALHVAGAPLREVQHQYRYIHDVWERHGPIDAMLELLPAAGILTLAAATDIVTVGLASPVTTLGAEAATGAMARIMHKDSWDRTANGEAYLDLKGRHVSFGRDIGKGLSHIPGISSQVTPGGSGWVSGAIDAIGDLTADPLAVAGRLRGGALSIEGAGGYRAATALEQAAGKGGELGEVPVGLSKIWGGLGVRNVENAYTQYPRFRNAVNDLAKITDEGDIARRYGENLGPLIPRLKAASTPSEVMDVFRGTATTNEILSGRLPTRSFTRIPFAALYEGMADPTGNAMNKAVAKMARLQNVFTPETMSFSTKSFSLDEKGLGYASEGVYKSLLMGMKPQDAADVVTSLYSTSSLEERENILRNSWVKMFDNLGIKQLKDSEGNLVDIADADRDLVRKKLFHKLEEVQGNRGGGPTFGRDATGRNASGFPNPDGSIENVPIHAGDVVDGEAIPHRDVGRHAFPDYQKVRHELMGLSRVKTLTGTAGEWWYDHYTSTVFKPLALATLGFAARVASGEIIPQAMKGEGWNMLKTRIALTAAKSNVNVIESEAPHIVAAVAKAGRPHIVKALEAGLDTPLGRDAAERLDFITKNIVDDGGHIINPALSSGHGVTSGDSDDLLFSHAADMLHRQQPPSMLDGKPLGDFEGRDLNEIYDWQHKIEGHVQDGPTRAAMQAYLDEIAPARSQIARVQGIPEEAGTAIPASATPAEAVPEALKPSAVAAEVADISPEAQKMAQIFQQAGQDWSVINRFPQDYWDQVAAASDIEGPISSQLKGEVRRLMQGETAVPKPTAAAPAAEAVEEAKPIQFGRAKAGQYGFESYPEQGGVIGQGKIEKVGKQWNVTYPGETEVASTHKSLKEAQQAVQDFAKKSHAAEMARRAENIKADIPHERAVQAAKVAAQDWLDRAPEELLNGNPRHRISNVDGKTPHEAWADSIVRTALADVTKPKSFELPIGDALHFDVIEDIANGRVTDLDKLAAVDATHRPDTLVGPAHTLPIKKGTIARVANWGHTKLFSPMINYMAREPMFQNLAWQEYNGGLKNAVDKGLMQDWEARLIARQRASFNMSKLVHNLNERTYMSESTRNWMPFAFAETQAWRRTGQLLIDDPGAFRRYQLASSMLMDVANPTKGEDGSSQMIFPGEGFLAQGAIKILDKMHIPMAGSVPLAFTGTVQSLGSVFPLTSLGDMEVPVGPLAALGVKAATSLFPELTPIGEKIVGSAGMQQSFMDMIVPNSTLRGLYHTFTGDHNRAFMNAQLYVIQDLARQQQEEDTKAAKEGRAAKEIVPGEDASTITKQDFMNKVKNQTRIVMGMRAILASFNPTATTAEIGESQLRDEVRSLIKEKGLAQGMQEFLSKHPDATPYTVFTSESNTAAPLSASSEVGSWLQRNLETLKGYAYGGAWLIPQAKDTFDQGVYNEQLAMSLRQRKAPDQFFKDIQIASSNNQYYALKDQYDKAVLAVGSDKVKKAALDRKWSGLKQAFGAQNPVWFEDYQSPERRIMRDNTIADFRRMIAHSDKIPQSPQFEGIKELVAGYDAFVEASLPGRTDAVAKAARASAERRWDAALDQFVADHPEQRPLVLKVFKGATVQAATTAQRAQEMTPVLDDLLTQLTPDMLAGRTP